MFTKDKYTLNISRDYSNYSLHYKDTVLDKNNKLDITKLLTEDILDSNFKVIKSPLKDKVIPAVIKLDKPFKCLGNKLVYKCYPDNKYYPVFLVKKSKKKSFQKYKNNQYVLIKYSEWTEKHPYATIINTIGDITITNTINYLLYTNNIPCKSFTFINKNNIKYNNNIKQEENIFTIDPVGSRDLDDALSIRKEGVYYIITTYISDVVTILEQYQLWNDLTSQVETLYTRDKIFTMLPEALSNNMCSLLEGNIRYVICTDFIIKDNKIIDSKIYRKRVIITTNYYYEEDRLLSLKDYQELYNVLYNLNIPIKYTIKDSHNIVELLMILTNYYCAKELARKQTGIFRKVEYNNNNNNNLHGELEVFLSRWKWMKSEYIVYNDSLHTNIAHDILQLDMYTHITSPIRRLVDILNQIVIYDAKVSKNAINFYTKWIQNITKINNSVKAIKKVERYSTALYYAAEFPERIYKAYILNENQVYISDIQQVHKLKAIGEEHQEIKVKIYIFWNDYKQKIRLMQQN